jgi:cell division ftsK/spoIIIE
VPPGHLALGIGGDTLSVRTIDMEDIGNGVLIYGPRRSGRSTALAFALDTALQTGARAILILPRRSPLTAWAHHPGVAGVLDATATVDQLTKLLNNDDNKNNDTLVVIDDLDILGKDHKLAAAVSSYMQTCRDHSGGVLIACNLDEVQGYGQNLLTLVRRNRTGVLLAPRESTDGERLHTPLPRSVGGPVPLGRGVMITTTGWSWIQVPRTAGPAPVVGGGIREGEQSRGG